MDYFNPATSRRSSIESMDYETEYNRQISQESPDDIENRFITEICQLLSLDQTEDDSCIIAKQLLINGRQELVRYRDHIASIDFDNQMDKKGNSTLLKVLKRYCEQQWQQNPLDWFNKFITEQQSLENDQHYQNVLTRTAEYGSKYMNKECPVFSIVLQLVFVFDNDINMADNIFNEIWNTFILEGCNIALRKWKKYIVSAKIKEYINSPNSPLFRALCECFREPVLSLFDQSKISDRQNLSEIALDCLANNGWTVGLDDERVKERISPKKYTSLMINLGKYLEKNQLILPAPNASRTPSKVVENFMKESPISDDNIQLPSNDPVIAYIPELPLTVVDSRELEDMIRQCLKRKHRQEVIGVKCSPYLGIGKVYLQNNNEKDHLIHVLKSIVLEFEKEDIIIKFTSDLELISYVVIESVNEEILPSPNEIARRWVRIYKSTRPPLCEQDFIQFPNIFRVVSDSLDELIQAMAMNQFSIDGHNATVYFRADRTFLEDLPRNTSTTQLRDVITNQISWENISTESCYIQYNKEAATAVIITCNRARKWALFNSINLNGQVIMKKTSLSYRLVVQPIPKDFPIRLIQNHRIFENSVRKISPEEDRLIVELSDKGVYEQCVNQGALSVADQLLHIETYTLPITPEENEINAKNWYETEMCRHKPNIMLFIDNRQHPIFHWKWNPRAFQEQFRHYVTVDPETDNNKKRHLLRTTVMLNTIGSVWKGSYRIAEREIKIKNDQLKTIVYDHRSTLQRSVKMPLSEAIQLPYPSTLVKVVEEDCLHVYQRLVAQRCRPVVLNMANAYSPGGGYRKGDGAQEETLFRRSNYFRSLDIDLDYGTPTSRFYCNSNSDLEILLENQKMYPMDEFGAIYTSGLTVFRQPENTGYAFMDEPLYDVCAIAMAAYRDPAVENNRLVAKFSISMRKKIENIFAIAYHHKHDCLILSAFGCGAFKNPPEHVATIFKSVAEQYAGFFKSIYFAILDDHNTGLQFNPQGNYRPFQQLLDDRKIRPKEHKLQDMMIGPWRILKMSNPQQVTLSDIRIFYLTPCYYGGQCNDLENVKHYREYSHPALCPSVGSGITCKLSNDADHILWLIHVSSRTQKVLIRNSNIFFCSQYLICIHHLLFLDLRLIFSPANLIHVLPLSIVFNKTTLII